MTDNNDGKINKIAIIGGLAIAACFIMKHKTNDNNQLLLEEQNRQNELRRIKSLRRQEFLHNIIYKIFKM